MKNKILLCFVLVAVIGISIFPLNSYAAVGVPFGGRVLFFVASGYYVPPYGPYCPPHVVILNFFGGKPTPLSLLLPPVQPKLFYNYIMTGNAVLGEYTPTPLPICPLYPVFPNNLEGSSLR